jgi:PPOX class probable F420-dependent enzyme
MKSIPNNFHDLFSEEKKAFAYLATLMADGSPQVTPVWFNTDGEYLLVNTARGRIKDRNMRARPQVAVCIADPDNPYRYLQIQGKIVAFTTEGAAAHIDTLAGKYTGKYKYTYGKPGEQRVLFKILPEKVDAHG